MAVTTAGAIGADAGLEFVHLVPPYLSARPDLENRSPSHTCSFAPHASVAGSETDFVL